MIVNLADPEPTDAERAESIMQTFALEAEKSKIREILDQIESLSIHDRADIATGGCIIETESGIINATVDNQWRALEAAFEKYVKR